MILDSQRILSYTFQLNPGLVLLSVVIEFSGLILAIPAWHLILARCGGQLSYQDDLRIYCYTLLGIVVPGGVWSLMGRVNLYQRQGVPGVRVTIATIVEYILIGLAGLAVYGLMMFFKPTQVLWQRPETALILTAIALILVQPPFFNRVILFISKQSGKINEDLTPWRYGDLGLLLCLEVLTIIVGGTAIYTLLQSFISIPVEAYLPVVSAWAAGAVVGNLLFWFPGRSVLRDGAMTLVLAQLLPPALALAFVFILRVWHIASILLAAGLAWLFLRRKSAKVVPSLK
ncbi:MAG: flippase-like domain-containing protein [Chloroflexi bacterium]|nr:flippase-like domain-containing protein [Chloroflexota bacterium]